MFTVCLALSSILNDREAQKKLAVVIRCGTAKIILKMGLEMGVMTELLLTQSLSVWLPRGGNV